MLYKAVQVLGQSSCSSRVLAAFGVGGSSEFQHNAETTCKQTALNHSQELFGVCVPCKLFGCSLVLMKPPSLEGRREADLTQLIPFFRTCQKAQLQALWDSE